MIWKACAIILTFYLVLSGSLAALVLLHPFGEGNDDLRDGMKKTLFPQQVFVEPDLQNEEVKDIQLL